jgi:hypothetical protein
MLASAPTSGLDLTLYPKDYYKNGPNFERTVAAEHFGGEHDAIRPPRRLCLLNAAHD